MRLPGAMWTGRPGRADRRGERGSAVLVVLAFVFIVEMLIISNTRTLDHLKRDLRLIEKKQQEKFLPPQGPATNRIPVRVQASGSRP
jgi:hypothetical protein